MGVQGTPAIFIFYLLFHLLQLNPQQPQHVSLHGKRANAPLLPPTTNPRCPPPAEHVPTSRTPECALVGTFWCSLFPSLISNQKVPMWALSGACAPLLSPPHLEHQNVPARACSGACTPPLSLSLVLNTRTSPCVACSGACAPLLFLSLVSSIRTSPHRLVLVLAHLSSPSPSSRTPERAHMGLFWCSCTSPLPLPRLEHQNKPTRARSGACAPPLSLSLISNTRTSPCGLILVLAHLPSPSPSSRTPERAHTGSF